MKIRIGGRAVKRSIDMWSYYSIPCRSWRVTVVTRTPLWRRGRAGTRRETRGPPSWPRTETLSTSVKHRRRSLPDWRRKYTTWPNRWGRLNSRYVWLIMIFEKVLQLFDILMLCKRNQILRIQQFNYLLTYLSSDKNSKWVGVFVWMVKGMASANYLYSIKTWQIICIL